MLAAAPFSMDRPMAIGLRARGARAEEIPWPLRSGCGDGLGERCALLMWSGSGTKGSSEPSAPPERTPAPGTISIGASERFGYADLTRLLLVDSLFARK